MLKAQARRSARGSRKVGTIILILALAELLHVYSAAPVARQQGRFKWSSQRFMRSYDDQMEAAIGSFW